MSLASTRRVYSGRVLNLDLDTVRFPDESLGTLEMIRHPGAAAVVPCLDPLGAADPRIVLIRQFRHAADRFIWEIPAGRLDPGEEPEACARRELAEETGYTAESLHSIGSILTTPGFTDERIHLFTAEGLRPGTAHREADEFVELHEVRWSRVLDLVRSGTIEDGKTLAALFRLSLAR